jgi:hypothetical protein
MNLNIRCWLPAWLVPEKAASTRPALLPRSRTFGTQSFMICLGVLMAVLLVYNGLIHFTSRTSQRRQMLSTLNRIPPDTDSLFLGNSLVEAGCDADSFKLAWARGDEAIHPANIALGATSPVEHYLILKHALAHNLHLKYIIYGFFDDQLNAPVHGDWSELVGNRALSYYFPDEAASLYAPGSALKRWQLRLSGYIPMLAERSSLWGKVELARRHLDEIGMPKHQTNRYGRVDDFSALEAHDTAAFNRRCEAVVNKRTGFSLPLREIIKLSQEHGAKLILVEMPMPSRHRKLFYSSSAWVELKQYLANLAADQNLCLISASDWIRDDDNFEDATHLNERGAKLFSAELAAKVSKLPGNSTEVARANSKPN